jgi:hypothetical protein
MLFRASVCLFCGLCDEYEGVRARKRCSSRESRMKLLEKTIEGVAVGAGTRQTDVKNWLLYIGEGVVAPSCRAFRTIYSSFK